MTILQLDGLAHGGEAVGRVDGKAVFVAGGIPGERVRVEVFEEARRYNRARLIKVLEASPDRVEPPCPYYAACGGCQLQHIPLPAAPGPPGCLTACRGLSAAGRRSAA